MKRFVLILIALLFIANCARTVSTGSDSVFVELKLTFRDSINLSNTIIVIPMSVATANIEPVNAAIDDYFIFPGLEYNDATLKNNEGVSTNVAGYYEEIFNTWSSFVYLSGSAGDNLNFYDSGEASFDATTNEDTHFGYSESEVSFEIVEQSISGAILTLVFDIEQLNYVESDTMNFSVLVFEKQSGYEAGYYQDTILSTDQAISFTLDKNNSDIENSLDSNEVLLDANHDLIEWSIQAY